MKRTQTFTKRFTTLTAAFLFAITGLTFLGISGNASAASGGFTIVNNCGGDRTFGYNYHDSAPGTGAYHEVANGTSYYVNSGTGIFRVELPKGVFNTFVYSGSNNSLTMC